MMGIITDESRALSVVKCLQLKNADLRRNCLFTQLCGVIDEACEIILQKIDFPKSHAVGPVVGQYYVRVRVMDKLPSGQVQISIMADNADGIRIYTDPKHIMTVADILRIEAERELDNE